jgi:hypothetical protein
MKPTRSRHFLLAVLTIGIRAGGVAIAAEEAGKPGGAAAVSVEGLQSQLRLLEQQTADLRRDVLTRLDQMDETRRAIEAGIEGHPAPARNAAAPETKNGRGEETGGAAQRVLRMVFGAVILAAVIFLARMAVSRWRVGGKAADPLEKTGIIRPAAPGRREGSGEPRK